MAVRLRSIGRRARAVACWWAVLAVGAVAAAALCHVALTRSGVQETYRTRAVEALGPETRALLLGSSHAYEGFDASAVDVPAMTLAADAFDYRVMESVLAAHLPRLQGLSVLLIEYDVALLLGDTLVRYGGDYRGFLEFRPDLDVLDTEPRLRARLRWEQTLAYSSALRPFFAREKLDPSNVLLLLKHKWHRPKAGFFATIQTMNERNTGEKVVAAQLRNQDASLLDRNLPALDRMITAAHERGIRVVLVRFPKHASYRAASPPEWADIVDTTLEGLRARHPDPPLDVWDFHVMEDLADDDYFDADHLNGRGARKLTAILRERVSDLVRAGR